MPSTDTDTPYHMTDIHYQDHMMQILMSGSVVTSFTFHNTLQTYVAPPFVLFTYHKAKLLTNSESQLCTSASSLTSPIQRALDFSTSKGSVSHVTA